MSVILIQSEVSGYAGKSINLLGALDTESGMLMISKQLAPDERRDGAVVITNDPRAERRDTLFSEDKLEESIRLYFRAKSGDLLELTNDLSKHDPGQKLQREGMNENGARYQLDSGITNGHIAVLAMVTAADQTYKAQSATDLSGQMAALFLSI